MGLAIFAFQVAAEEIYESSIAVPCQVPVVIVPSVTRLEFPALTEYVPDKSGMSLALAAVKAPDDAFSNPVNELPIVVKLVKLDTLEVKGVVQVKEVPLAGIEST